MVYLEEMYPLTVGYRANELAESYTPRDATIKLASRDFGIVPPAPNRITITDFDEETNTPYVVTVLYRATEGNELRDLTVEEGDSPESRTTHVYPEGSKVFRPLTRADVQTIINNIKHLNEDSGAVRYDEEQSLSPIQQLRARNNINVSADVTWGKLSGDISDNAAITNALAAKQDTITSEAKLSADLIADGTANKVFSAADKSKLAGIAAGAEVNVQPDWEATDAQSDAFIANKPFSSIGDGLTVTDGVLSADAQPQLQSDWRRIDSTSPDYIRNKPFTKIGTGLTVTDGVLSADAAEQQQSDWNQQDETKLDHIKNKPFQSIGTGLTVTDGVLSADATEQQQSDWGQVDTTKIDYIKNKPFKTIGEGLSVTDGVLSADAQPQQQSDWGQVDTTKADYIKNKPFASIGDGLSVNDGVLSADAQPQLQSDWTQTDSASADFVKNKPFKAIGDGLTVTETGDLIPNIPLATAQTPGLMYPESNVLTVYVSPEGNDATGDGTQDNPWREIDTAIQRTNDLPNHNITISCAGGQYDGFTTPSEAHNYMIRTLASVDISGNIKINGSNVVIISNSTNADFSVHSPDDIGISINYGGKLAVYHALVKIEAKRYGVYINRDLSSSNDAGSSAFNIISSVIFPHIDVKLTNTTGKAAGICCNWATHPVMIGNLAVDCASSDGFGIIVDGNYYFQPSVAIIRNLSCNVSDYQLSGGAMLSINGSWVDQSMGGPTWGTITGDLQQQADLIQYIKSRPTILSGTTDPTPEMGKIGDLYVRYAL